MTNEEYIAFMTNPENANNCKECPGNKGFGSWQDRKPCGQWHCWVVAHCWVKEGANDETL